MLLQALNGLTNLSCFLPSLIHQAAAAMLIIELVCSILNSTIVN